MFRIISRYNLSIPSCQTKNSIFFVISLSQLYHLKLYLKWVESEYEDDSVIITHRDSILSMQGQPDKQVLYIGSFTFSLGHVHYGVINPYCENPLFNSLAPTLLLFSRGYTNLNINKNWRSILVVVAKWRHNTNVLLVLITKLLANYHMQYESNGRGEGEMSLGKDERKALERESHWYHNFCFSSLYRNSAPKSVLSGHHLLHPWLCIGMKSFEKCTRKYS